MTVFLAAAVIAGTPLLFATLGELITEKAGNLNLGVEGMMLMGAVMGFAVGLWTGNPFFAILGAVGAGALGSAVYAILTVTLRANQVVTGLTLTIFGTGFASFVGKSFMGVPAPASVKSAFAELKIPLLSKIPVIGPTFFEQDIFIYFGYLITICASLYLWRTKKGLNLKAVGENAAAADASGINVNLYKYVHIILGGALCGLGGAYMSLVTIPVGGKLGGRPRSGLGGAGDLRFWKPSKALIGAFLY